ncbi:TFIIA-alpha and beta-like factor [Cyrtonyx montezumae]|uniref:TFIIA-alpha and beta-like factor n=1 Tax=Cyrtonyx montezumae TaxID=9017 RepID=UPI0032D9EF23
MAHANPLPKLYRSVIEDVIENIQDLFAEEGVDKQVLRNLKELWETKVIQSKAIDGFFRHSHHSSHLTLQLPPNFSHVLQASSASLIIPTGGGFQHFVAADPGASQKCATLTLPSSVAYPIHVPAGLTLQTASGQLYKVNMPVMVARGQGNASILQHPLQQVFQHIGPPSVLKTNAPVETSSIQAAAEVLQAQKTEVQQTVVFQPSALQNNHPNNSTNTTLFLQPAASQQEIATNAVLSQHAESTAKSQYGNLCTAVFTSGSSEVLSPAEYLANNPGSVLLPDVEGQLDMKPQETVQQQVSDITERIIKGKSLRGNAALKGQDSRAPTDKMEPTEQVESNLQSEKGIYSDIEGIIQLDGTGDRSPKKEVVHTKDSEENEFIDIIQSEDLKILEDEEDEEVDSISSLESVSSNCDNEEPQTDIVEEDPLNSDDDVSDLDVADLFDTNNVIVCQYEKIHRSKNKWKFFLKDGVMSFDGKDYVFAKAVGDAEW